MMNPFRVFPVSVVISAASALLGSALFILFVIFFSPVATTLVPVAEFPTPFVLDDTALEAKAALVYDPTTKQVLFAKGAEYPLPLASITKLMTAYTILATHPSNQLVAITSADLEPEGDWGFLPGDQIKLYDLITFGLVASSNDAITAAASSIGDDYITQMNKEAGRLGLAHSLFFNATGLDVDAQTAGAYGSAIDVATLVSAFMHDFPDYFEQTTRSSISIGDGDRTLLAAATTAPLRDIPGFVGAKTGYTDLAGGNLVAVFDAELGHPIIGVVLGSSVDGRFADMHTLIHMVHAQ